MAPPPMQPAWVDTNILINIARGTQPHAETYILELQKKGHEVLITRHVEREFLHAPGADTAQAQGVINRLQLKVDTMVDQIPAQQVRAWQRQAMGNLSVDDAIIVSEVRASAAARGIRNPTLLTVEQPGAIAHMRRNGVLAVDVRDSMPVRPKSTPKPPPIPPVSPSPGGVPQGRLSAAKDALKAGIRGAFSLPNLASMIPEVILAIADKVAARDALRDIQVKFLKEGFAKGVAAGVMGWTEAEVESNLLKGGRITPFRIQGMGDAAGNLKRGDMIKVADAYEVYGAAVGYLFSSANTSAWKTNMRGKGFETLKQYRYHYPDDPQILFEYEFINDLAFALHLTTDAIVEPAIRYN